MAQRDRRPAQRRVVYPAPRQLFETDNRDTITCENLCRAAYEPVVSNVVYIETRSLKTTSPDMPPVPPPPSTTPTQRRGAPGSDHSPVLSVIDL
jgi:hypothetical protein